MRHRARAHLGPEHRARSRPRLREYAPPELIDVVDEEEEDIAEALPSELPKRLSVVHSAEPSNETLS